MSFNTEVKGQLEIAVRLTGSTVTDIVDGSTAAYYVPWVCLGEHAGTTPNLTVALYDGTNSYYLGSDGYTWNALAVYPYQSLFFRDIVVPKGWKLRAQSSNGSGNFHATGAKVQRIPVGGLTA